MRMSSQRAPAHLALFCSSKCPGALILDAADFCRDLRGQPVTVVSGFDSPVEQQCLRILLRSVNPLVWCLARGKPTSVPPEVREPIAKGRLQIVAPFPDNVRRKTAATCAKRNRVVAGMADATLVVHAAQGSKVEALSRSLLAAGKPVFTFDHRANAELISAGARPIKSVSELRL